MNNQPGCISSEYRLNCVYIDFTADGIPDDVYIEPTPETEVIIGQYNLYAETKYGPISLNDVLFHSDDVNKITDQIYQDMDMYKNIFVEINDDIYKMVFGDKNNVNGIICQKW